MCAVLSDSLLSADAMGTFSPVMVLLYNQDRCLAIFYFGHNGVFTILTINIWESVLSIYK